LATVERRLCCSFILEQQYMMAYRGKKLQPKAGKQRARSET
jgi:hypothetical protein